MNYPKSNNSSPVFLEYRNGINVINSLLQTGSPAKELMSRYQIDGLYKLRETLLLEAKLPSINEDKCIDSSSTEKVTQSKKRRDSSKKQLKRQQTEDSPTEFSGEPSGRIQDKSESESPKSIIPTQIFVDRATTSKQFSNHRRSAHAPVEWYQLERENQEKLYSLLSWKNLMKWDFNVFEVSQISGGKPLLFIGWAILASPHSQRIMEESIQRNNDGENIERNGYNFLDTYKINPECMIDFLRAIEDQYLDNNPYHNKIHAADVLQTMHSFLEEMGAKNLGNTRKKKGNRKDSVSFPSMALQKFSLLVGAAIHDVGHPGYNNAFQTNSRSQLALTYHDESVLENYHISLAFKMVNDNTDLNIFKNMDPSEFVECKRLITEAILGTDMKFHFTQLDKIKKELSQRKDDNPGKNIMSPEASWEIMKFLVHMADISNLAKRSSVSIQWTDRVLIEFFRQGDKEKELGLPVSMLCDRDTTSPPDSQMGFINYIIRPSFEVLQQCLPSIKKLVLPNVEANYKMWEIESYQENKKEINEIKRVQKSRKIKVVTSKAA